MRKTFLIVLSILALSASSALAVDLTPTPSFGGFTTSAGRVKATKPGDMIELKFPSATVNKSGKTITVTVPQIPGPKGDAGPKGDQGIQGTQGPKGDQGVAGNAGLSLNWREYWTTSPTGYVKDDAVERLGSSYRALAYSSGVDPANDLLYQYWFPVARQGAKGDKGDKGNTGDQGIPGIPGTQGIQGIQGIQGNQGVKGDKGDAGTQGTQGIQGIQGAKGDKGDQGIQGPVDTTTLNAFKSYTSIDRLTKTEAAATYAPTSILASVATSGDYSSLTGKPDLTLKESTSNKGATNGYAALVSGTVPIAQLPVGTTSTSVAAGNAAPNLHHLTHSTGGTDAIAPGDIGAATALANHIYLSSCSGTAINAAIAAAPAQSKIILPAGTCDMGANVITWPLGKHYVTLEGAGGGASTIIQTSANDTALKIGTYAYSGSDTWSYGSHALYGISVKHIYFKSTASTKTATVGIDLRGVNNGNFNDISFSGFREGIVVNPVSNWNQITNIRSTGTDTVNTVRVQGDGFTADYNSTGNTYSNIQGQSVKTGVLQFTGCAFGDAVISNVIGTGAVGATAAVYLNSPGTTCGDTTSKYASRIAISNVDFDGPAGAGIEAVIKEVNVIENVIASGLIKGGSVGAFVVGTDAGFKNLDNALQPTAISNTAYDATSWNGDTTHAASKDAVRDKIEAMSGSFGEANTASNLGTGDGMFAQKSVADLQFKSLKAGANITITPSSTELLIDATGGGTYPAAGIAVSTGIAWGTSKTSPSGAIVGDTDAQSLSNKTLTSPSLTNGTVNASVTLPTPSASLSSGGSLTNGQTYCYAMTAIMGYLVETIRSTETCVTATSTNKTATITWSAVTGATSYRLYRTTTSGDYTASKWQSAASGFADNGTLFVATTSAPPSTTQPYVKFNNGSIGINVDTPVVPFHLAAANAGGLVLLDGYNVSSTGTGTLGLRAARNTMAAPSAVQAGDALGAINFRGYGATGWAGSGRAAIYGYASENYTDTAQGSHLAFETTAIGGATRNEKVRIHGSGNVSIGNTNDTHKLEVAGDIFAKTLAATIPAAATDAATVTFDLSAGDSPSVTLGGNRTLAFTNPQVGAWYTLELIQDATGGRTVTWPTTGLVCTFIKSDGSRTITGPTLHTAASSGANIITDTIVIHPTSTTAAKCYAAGY